MNRWPITIFLMNKSTTNLRIQIGINWQICQLTPLKQDTLSGMLRFNEDFSTHCDCVDFEFSTFSFFGI